MRASLFLKIFLGFWLVIIAVLGSWQLSSQYFESRVFSEAPGEREKGPPQRQVLRLIWALENTPSAQLGALVRRANDQDRRAEVWLLDAQGLDINARPVPQEVQAVAERLLHGSRRAFEPGKRRHVFAHVINRPGAENWRLAIARPAPRSRFLGALGTSPGLRLLLAALVSGLACWWLSRLLTNRLQALRAASGQLASGDLSARISVRERGGDETDQLARDFNSMADQLSQRMQAQKQMLADVSHELRSPLARLRVALALAQDADGKRDDYLQRMDKETARLEELISQLLSSQQRDLSMDRHVDLVRLLRDLCADASFEGASENKRVVLATQAQQAVIATHEDLLLKSFDNIIRNALQHTPAGSTVTVALTADKNSIEVSVEDRGPGLQEAELQRIFEAFYRVDKARSPGQGGYGLGLAIAKRGIEQHGGTLRAANTPAGLRVTATLPLKS
ncbi:HAMP domain-containing protein [Pseudohalioglobus sediminis]|uniref:histidine kinase n=1 Tax=Pseudohalioglobus sediminis TaxID=2606449 RepID=A0A5B0X3Z9_9GAMM|nr:ATP-binding protein [Pseudohalioglobus sediminis]KAA1193267.1 HAMP domain-containing protein [Pseudohalioglobus sediminis]